jgi:hypothetical protein
MKATRAAPTGGSNGHDVVVVVALGLCSAPSAGNAGRFFVIFFGAGAIVVGLAEL